MKSTAALKENTAFGLHKMGFFPYCLPELEVMHDSNKNFESAAELNVSFGYQCSITQDPISDSITQDPVSDILCKFEITTEIHSQESNFLMRSSSFSGLSGAALSANATLANTNICNGLIGEEILPNLDSPKSFKRLPSSPSLPRLDFLSSSSPSSFPPMVRSISTDNDFLESVQYMGKTSSAPTVLETSSFLNAMNVQMAGGAAGEDRVQAVCSEENGWLFCGVYDGFNGRDAADFLASTLYENIVLHLHHLEWLMKNRDDSGVIPDTGNQKSLSDSFRTGVLDSLSHALAKAESEFMDRVEEEMEDRPDLVSVGSGVLAMLLHGMDLYIMNLGDSRAVLATSSVSSPSQLQAIQLTEIHSVDNEIERMKVLADHPDDPSPIIGGKVKGKLKLTRALGVGYLKKRKLNNALMGILRVQNLCSPPYVYTHPFTVSHRVSENDLFVVLGSDGLFDFFSNDEVINLAHQFIQDNPVGDPAKYLVEQLVLRAAQNAGFSAEELMSVPVGRRRKYHDDVTVVVIILGNKQRTSKASTSLQ